MNFSISPCDNYILCIYSVAGEINPYIEVIEVSSGRVLSNSVLQGCSFRSQIFVDWCGGLCELYFIVIAPSLVQLWRLNARSRLEFLNLESVQKNCRCAASTELLGKDLLFLCNENSMVIYDLRTTRAMCSILSLTT